LNAVAYAENFHGGWFIQWHMVVICIWCALFVTSQFDVIFMFPNYFVNCQRSKLGYRRNIHSKLRHSSS